MSPLRFIRNVLVALSGRTSPSELAGSAAMGMLVGLVPKGNLLGQLLFFSLFILGVNFPIAMASAALFLLASPLTDILADKLGYGLLVQASFLEPFWTWLYNRPVLPWTSFNNTLVLGNFVLGLALYLPVYFLSKKGVLWYQARLRETVLKWKIVQLVKASAFVRWLNG